MSDEFVIIKVPDILGKDGHEIENFYNRISQPLPDRQYVLDLNQVNFIRPYGVIALVIAGRNLSKTSGRKVIVQNISMQVYQYLERMNLFDVGSDWLQPTGILKERWNRTSHTYNLLELTIINQSKDIETVVSRSDNIFERWLQRSYLHDLLNVLIELCANVHEHSGDCYGCVLIQKVTSQGQAVVRLAVGDIGCGVRGSLFGSKKYNALEDSLDYLLKAMNGQTSRLTGRGGLGLRQVERIAGASSGCLWLRSENSAIFSRGTGTIQGIRNLAYVPGTQVAVELRSPIDIK